MTTPAVLGRLEHRKLPIAPGLTFCAVHAETGTNPSADACDPPANASGSPVRVYRCVAGLTRIELELLTHLAYVTFVMAVEPALVGTRFAPSQAGPRTRVTLNSTGTSSARPMIERCAPGIPGHWYEWIGRDDVRA